MKLLLAIPFLFVGCNQFDINASASYNGVTVTGTRSSGRNAVGVNVDAKRVVRAIYR